VGGISTAIVELVLVEPVVVAEVVMMAIGLSDGALEGLAVGVFVVMIGFPVGASEVGLAVGLGISTEVVDTAVVVADGDDPAAVVVPAVVVVIYIN